MCSGRWSIDPEQRPLFAAAPRYQLQVPDGLGRSRENISRVIISIERIIKRVIQVIGTQNIAGDIAHAAVRIVHPIQLDGVRGTAGPRDVLNSAAVPSTASVGRQRSMGPFWLTAARQKQARIEAG